MIISSSRDEITLVAKLGNRYFRWFPAAMLVPLRGAQTWRSHIKLNKSGKNIPPNISHMKNCIDPNLCIHSLSLFPRFWTLSIQLSIERL